MKPVTLPPLRSTRLLDQVRERVRYMHYSLSTEHSYVQWVRRYVHFHELRHPRDLGGPQVEAFLSHLANQRQASASTHKQALSALLFLYRRVLGVDLPWMQLIGRPRTPVRLPNVLSRAEVERLLALTTGATGLAARLLYGTGMRKTECLRLRVKDLDFDRGVIVVREGKGNKDRRTLLPQSLVSALRDQLQHAHALWRGDRAAARPGVEIPPGLARKYPRAAQSWAWFWVSPPHMSRLTRAVVSSVGIICSKTAFSARSGVPVRWPVSASRWARTRCATRLPPTFWSAVRTSARSRNCWATVMWTRP